MNNPILFPIIVITMFISAIFLVIAGIYSYSHFKQKLYSKSLFLFGISSVLIIIEVLLFKCI